VCVKRNELKYRADGHDMGLPVIWRGR